MDSVAGIGQRLSDCARRAFDYAMTVARAGNRVSEIGPVLLRLRFSGSGFFVIRESLGGHGIGHTIHERPSVPNFADASLKPKLS